MRISPFLIPPLPHPPPTPAPTTTTCRAATFRLQGLSSVFCISVCPNSCVAASTWVGFFLLFFLCSHVYMRWHTGRCTDTVRESALKVDSGREIPLRTAESSLPQQRAGPDAQLRDLHTSPPQLMSHEINSVAARQRITS